MKDSYTKFLIYQGYDKSTPNLDQTIDTLFNVLNDYKYFNTYNQDLFKQVVTTIHSAKGLEYKQIIIFADNYNFKDDDNRFLHYVAVTRPEEKLLILCDGNYSFNNYMSKINNAIGETKKLGIEIEVDDITKIMND